jgi:glycine/D-amino acid oxidase-like deaminating enzyme
LRGIRFTHRWGGPVSITTDVAPAIGFVGDDKRAVYSVGCAGHGVGLTPQNGRTLAELLTGQQTERTETFFVGRSVLSWPPEPLRFVLGQAVRGALRLGDVMLYRN